LTGLGTSRGIPEAYRVQLIAAQSDIVVAHVDYQRREFPFIGARFSHCPDRPGDIVGSWNTGRALWKRIFI
jgi:hypothetical protein